MRLKLLLLISKLRKLNNESNRGLLLRMILYVIICLCLSLAPMPIKCSASESNMNTNITNVKQIVQEECDKYNISYELVMAIMKVESNFKSNAVSECGRSKGLMQISTINYKQLSNALNVNFDPFNPTHNIRGGVYLLSNYRDYWYKQWVTEEDLAYLVLISYNRGLDNSIRYVNKYDFTKNKYANKVLNVKYSYEKEGLIL